MPAGDLSGIAHRAVVEGRNVEAVTGCTIELRGFLEPRGTRKPHFNLWMRHRTGKHNGGLLLGRLSFPAKVGVFVPCSFFVGPQWTSNVVALASTPSAPTRTPEYDARSSPPPPPPVLSFVQSSSYGLLQGEQYDETRRDVTPTGVAGPPPLPRTYGQGS